MAYSGAMAVKIGFITLTVRSQHKQKASSTPSPSPMAPDFSLSSSSSTNLLSRRFDLVFVVNPLGANGKTGKQWKNLLPYLRSRLSPMFNICESFTSGPSHATEITREAIRKGANAVVAVGGDGTLHEVVNGFFWDGKHVSANHETSAYRTALGLIPLGTGSDFARTFGWKNNPYEAVDRIAKGMRARLDVGVITAEDRGPHYFINVADIHLSAKAGYYASRYKKFGNLCYVIGALQAFMGHKNVDLRIKIDDGDWKKYPQVTALCIGNAKYFGGGMKITPNAEPSSGSFEVVVLQDFKWYDFILNLLNLYNGTHLSVKNVTSKSIRSIEVEEIDDSGTIYIQSDGEYLGGPQAATAAHPSPEHRLLNLSRLRHDPLKTCRIKCHAQNKENPAISSSNSSSLKQENGAEPENVILKVAWYASELLGIAASALRSPPTDAVSDYLELPVDGSGAVDRAAVVETIKQDFQRSYFVTGNLTLGAYEEECEFADPAGSFKGLQRFKRNCTNFGSLVQKANMKLMKWEDFEDKGVGHWRFSCILSFPWRPILSATGYTEYYFNSESGKVCRHVEHWNVPKMTLLKQILKPSRQISSKAN